MAVARNLLIVEGKDDLHVMLALRDKLGLKERYEIRDKDNDDQLLKSISTEAKTSGRKALGIVIDRDTDDPDKNKEMGTNQRSSNSYGLRHNYTGCS